MAADVPDRGHLTRFAWLSVAAAVATIAIKTIARSLEREPKALAIRWRPE